MISEARSAILRLQEEKPHGDVGAEVLLSAIPPQVSALSKHHGMNLFESTALKSPHAQAIAMTRLSEEPLSELIR